MKRNIDTKIKIRCIYVETFKTRYLVLRNKVFIHTCTENFVQYFTNNWKLLVMKIKNCKIRRINE